MTIYFSSDPHLEHARVLQYCARHWAGGGKFHKAEDFDPKSDEAKAAVQKMDEALVALWNEKVKRDDDIVYLLGDCAMNAKKAIPFLEQLRGRKRLIRGNHDHDIVKKGAHLFEWIRDYYVATVDVTHPPNIISSVPTYEQAKVVLFHFPIEVWDGKGRDPMWLHFHGHSHGSTPDSRKIKGRVDVGVDCWDGKPVTFQEARERALSYSAVLEDHHGAD